MLVGVLWAIFAPVAIVAAAALLAWLLHRLAPARLGLLPSIAIAAMLVSAPVYALWRQDREAFRTLCRAEGAPTIFETARADGFLLTSSTSNSFGMRYLQQEGFAWMESNGIYKRGGFVRYARDDKGAISATKIDGPTARYEVRETFEQRAPGVDISRTQVVDRKTGREMARASSLTFDGGRARWLLGAWGVESCPAARDDVEAFNAYYHLAKDTLRGR